MNEPKFTKGPWSIELKKNRNPNTDNIYDIWINDGSKSCHGLVKVMSWRSDSESNANLIAAAPDMYELLDDLKESITDIFEDVTVSGVIDHIDYDKLCEIERLLQQARGES